MLEKWMVLVAREVCKRTQKPRILTPGRGKVGAHDTSSSGKMTGWWNRYGQVRAKLCLEWFVGDTRALSSAGEGFRNPWVPREDSDIRETKEMHGGSPGSMTHSPSPLIPPPGDRLVGATKRARKRAESVRCTRHVAENIWEALCDVSTENKIKAI